MERNEADETLGRSSRKCPHRTATRYRRSPKNYSLLSSTMTPTWYDCTKNGGQMLQDAIVKVMFTCGKSAEDLKDKTILDISEDQGVVIPFGCRHGRLWRM